MSTRNIDPMSVRNLNRNKIFQFLYGREPQSNQDIAYALGLSLPTVTQNIKTLKEMGLLQDAGVFESTGGRKAQAITFDKTARYAVGLDVTQNHIGIVLLNLGGEVVLHERFRIEFENEDGYFRNTGKLIDLFLNSKHIPPEHILGVGIGMPAIVDEEHKTLTYSSVLQFPSGSIDRFAEYIPYPCMFCNDANAAGFAEIWVSDYLENMIYLSLSNSVGGAVLLNDTICYGENQRCGEFGHMTIHPTGKQCYCGQRGCVDAHCNAQVLSASANGKLEDFFDMLNAGDKNIVQLWDTYLDDLAIAVNNLRMNFDYVVVLGGYIGSYMDDYIDDLRKRVASRNTFEPDGTYLKVCTHKQQATAVGAALYYVDEFIKNV